MRRTAKDEHASSTLQRAFGAAFLAIAAGCATEYHMGEPIQPAAVPKPQESASAASSAPVRPSTPPHELTSAELKRAKQAAEWEAKWLQIQSSNDQVDWVDHFRVCAIKYRYRSYDELFRCLDFFEAKVARGRGVSDLDEARRVAPVIAGWMRATAYTELGEPELGLKWAGEAWDAVPRQYQEVSSRLYASVLPLDVDAKEYLKGAMRVGGSSNPANNPEEKFARWGRDNPAGLDLSPETITMSLAAQRCMLYQRLGETARAQAALDDLRKWERPRRFMGRAWLVSLGPLFAIGNYSEVVERYERYTQAVARNQRQAKFLDATDWVVVAPLKALSKGMDRAYDAVFTASDIRLFTIATEDASNALIYAESLEQLGRIDQARAMYDKLLALPETRGMGNLYWAMLYQRGRIALKDGKQADALHFFTEAVNAIESVRTTISVEGAKIGFAGDKQAVYGALVSLLAARGDWDGAFRTAERAKARALVDLLAQRHDLPPPAAADDKVRELFARAQTSEARVGLPSSEEAARGIQIIAEARTSLVAAAPEAASLVSVEQVATEEVGARLSHDETLVDYYATGDDLYAFVLNGKTVMGFKLSAKGLEEEVRAFRKSIEGRAADTHARGQALYARLIQPLAAQIRGDALTIAPHGALHYLPFGALQDGDRYLIDSSSIRLTPSAQALAYVKSDHPTKPAKLLALGNPDLGDPRYDLPNAQVEAVNIAAMFPDSRALVRAQASKSAIKALGNGFSILHFATHGRFDSDSPLSSGLYLAKGDEADGVLTVSDLYSLRWDVDLVTLSACETGLGKVASGDDVIGLTRGFLYAGARSIVASLWEVDDAATEQLMVSFYRKLDTHTKRDALRLAQIETRAQYPDPRYWAAFEITGRAD